MGGSFKKATFDIMKMGENGDFMYYQVDGSRAQDQAEPSDAPVRPRTALFEKAGCGAWLEKPLLD